MNNSIDTNMLQDMINGGFDFNSKLDTEGNMVKKTQSRYPYSYDTFIMAGEANIEPTDSACYSDRLMQWDFKLHDKCLTEVFGDTGQFWSQRGFEDTEKFLQLYFKNTSIKLIRILQGCNASNGYPFWVFEYNE